MELGVFEMVVLVTLIGCATGAISKYLGFGTALVTQDILLKKASSGKSPPRQR